MANFDQLVCTTTGAPGNTGFNPTCYLDILRLMGAALVPSDMVIPEQYLTADGIVPYLKTLALSDDPSSRIYPIHGLILETAGGGDNRTYTDPYGGTSVTGENPYAWLFQFRNGGAQLLANLRKFNSNGQWNLIVWDKKTIYFANNGDGTASGLNLLSNWANALQPPTGQDPTLYRLFISMTTDQLNDSRFALQYNGSMASIKGLQDITLSLLSYNPTNSSASITVNVNNKNLYLKYKTALSGTGKALWQASNVETGGIVPITTVTAVDSNQSFSVLLNNLDSNFPADIKKAKITLVGPTELNTANIAGFEAQNDAEVGYNVALLASGTGSVTLTKPSTNNILYVSNLLTDDVQNLTSISSNITGTLANGDVTNFKLYANAHPVLDGQQTLIGTYTANLVSGAVPSFNLATTYPAGSMYFILTADIPSGAATGHTIIAAKLSYVGLTGLITDNQVNAGGTKTLA